MSTLSCCFGGSGEDMPSQSWLQRPDRGSVRWGHATVGLFIDIAELRWERPRKRGKGELGTDKGSIGLQTTSWL